jgi:isoleucyl-tRNA synthetase
VLDHLFHCLTAWLAPALVFTAEEAWLARFPGEAESVHLRTFPEIPKTWRNDALGADWAKVRELRGAATAAMEIDRAAKKIGASLQAKIRATAAPEQAAAIRALGLGPADLAEIAIVSAFELREGEASAVEVHLAEGQKCARCWQVLPEVGKGRKPDLCLRCDDAVAKA